jgi:hypothetical protein
MERIHLWEKHEITLVAKKSHANAYMNVEMGVRLHGPGGFDKKVHGFWDGESTFRVRVTATRPGTWTWESFANVDDAGLRGQRGSYEAVAWSEAELEANLCRRGFVRPTANRHAFELADGTPFFWLADMWLAAATQYYPWREDEKDYGIGPEVGFKDMIRARAKQGFNGITLIACFPAWAIDRLPASADTDDGMVLRRSWHEHGSNLIFDGRKDRSKDMHI